MGLFGKKTSSGIERAAMALATAGGIAHVAFFGVFVSRVIGREGIGTIGYAILAVFALAGIAMNFVGYWLIRQGGRPAARRLGYLAVSISTALAGALLAIATWTK